MPRQDPRPNLRLGNKYLLGELLGEGGFGAVYRAHNQLLDRVEAIKIVGPRGLNDPKWQQRFMREAQMLAKLEHQNIIPVYDCGFDVETEILYLAMPFMDGGTLEDILRGQQKPLSLKVTEHFLQQICSALDYAHAQGVVHLDLKPANLLLRRRDASTLLLSDFGLAHLVEEEHIKGGTSLQFGTPHYMAPEQIKGQPQPSSDIYALGVILYRMLTNQFPYSGAGPSIYIDHLQSPIPRLSTIRSDLPIALDQTIANALAKNHAERYQHADILLKSFQTAIIPPAPKPRVAPSPMPAQPPRRSMYEDPFDDEEIAPKPVRQRRRLQQPRAISKQQQAQIAVEPEVDPYPLKKTSAERRQAFIKKIYSFMTSNTGIWLLPLFFFIGLGSILGTYIQYQFALVVMAATGLLGYLLAHRKTTSLFTFVLTLLCSGTMIFLLSEKVLHVFPVLQQYKPVQISLWLLGSRDFWVGRQVNAGIIIGSIYAFIWYPVFFINNNDLRSIPTHLTLTVGVSLICSVLTWLIVSVLAIIFNWGFGFGDGWYLNLLYQLIGIIAAIGLADFIYVLFRRFE